MRAVDVCSTRAINTKLCSTRAVDVQACEGYPHVPYESRVRWMLGMRLYDPGMAGYGDYE